MYKKKRAGNLLITVMVFLVLTLALSGLIPTTQSQKYSAHEKANRAGDVNSYITLTNVCAAAFKEDLESQSLQLVVANVANPEGLDYEIPFEVFAQAIEFLQNGTVEGEPGYSVSPGLNDTSRIPAEPGAWYHYLTDPRMALEYEGISNTKVLELANRLLTDATVSIKVLAPLSVEATRGVNEVKISDIYFQVVMEKGTTKVVQDYRLTGEMLEGRPNESVALVQVNSENAELILEGQMVTRKNLP